ncbi:unnamed protein product [Spirodela intermedia]|uniref:PH domain-containing protein n=1 Tax=Spirodela intermedia TaxID=51605 RepID=A0A7I8J660_SPIIN|nr:unnamed protein product [Spirodela intermedia]CAA6665726.1 unnamed protein product [Spirodela intermedia]
MGDGLGKIEIIPDHFQGPASSEDSPRTGKTECPLRSRRRTRVGGRLMNAGSMLRLFSLPGLPGPLGSMATRWVELSAAQVESLRSEIADAEEREAHLKAQLEHVDEILRSARLAGYLHLRNRWTQLPGEPPIIDDVEVDDWLPRFVVLSGQCLFYYLRSTDLSPQDSTLLSDITEDQEARHALYILTRHGLRFECASPSRAQVDSWLTTLREDCNLGSPEGSDRSNLD